MSYIIPPKYKKFIPLFENEAPTISTTTLKVDVSFYDGYPVRVIGNLFPIGVDGSVSLNTSIRDNTTLQTLHGVGSEEDGAAVIGLQSNTNKIIDSIFRESVWDYGGLGQLLVLDVFKPVTSVSNDVFLFKYDLYKLNLVISPNYRKSSFSGHIVMSPELALSNLFLEFGAGTSFDSKTLFSAYYSVGDYFAS